MVVKTRTQQLNGLQSLAYVGVRPSSPNNFLIEQRKPTVNDYRNVYIGDFWLDNSSSYPQAGPPLVSPTPPTTGNLYILTSVANGVATWQPFAGGSMSIITLTGNSGGPISPTAGNINVRGDGTTVNVVGNPGTSTLTISSAGSVPIIFPTDSGSAVPSGGSLTIKAGNAANNDGSSVLFTGSGSTVQLNLTDANGNTIIGKSGGNLTLTGVNSAIYGATAASALTSGSRNQIFGYGSGTSYTIESNNVLINNAGTIADANTIRIGTQGSGNGQQNLNFQAGIYGVTPSGSSFQPVIINSSGQLGSAVETNWTPILSFGGASTGITYAQNTGVFWQIGILVFFQLTIELSSKGSSTGSAAITLPTAGSLNQYQAQFRSIHMTFGANSFISAKIGSAINLEYCDDTGGVTALADTNFANNTGIWITGFYNIGA